MGVKFLGRKKKSWREGAIFETALPKNFLLPPSRAIRNAPKIASYAPITAGGGGTNCDKSHHGVVERRINASC